MIDDNVFEKPSTQRICSTRSHRIVAHSESQVSDYHIISRNNDRKIPNTDTIARS